MSAAIVFVLLIIAIITALWIDGPAGAAPAAPPATDTGGAGGSLSPQGTPATPSTPPAVSPASPAVAPPAATDVPPAAGAPAVGSPAVGAPAVAPQPTWLDGLRQQGFDLGTDEGAAQQQLIAMAKALQQIQPMLPFVQGYQRHAPQFHTWLQQQTNQPAPTQSDPWHKEFWNPPEWNPQWTEQYIVTDAAGKRDWAPNTPAEVKAKAEGYLAWQRDQQAKMVSNPFEYFGPAIDKRARAMAETIVQETMARQRDMQQSQSFVQQNANWLYELDASGQKKMVPQLNTSNGRWENSPVLSEWGHRWAGYVRELSSKGYSIDDQQRFATAFVERDFLAAKYRTAGATPPAVAAPGVIPGAAALTPQQAANNAFLAQNNPAAAQPGTNGTPRFQDAPNPKSKGEAEAEMLAALKARGIMSI